MIIISATNTNRSDQQLLLVRLEVAGTKPYLHVLLVSGRPVTAQLFHIRLPPGLFGCTVLLRILLPIFDVDPILT